MIADFIEFIIELNVTDKLFASHCHTVVVGLIDFVLRSGHLEDGPDVVDDTGDLKLV